MYPLHFGSMTDDYYFAARINSDDGDFLDFKLSGKAKGWVAVGFSATRAMVRERRNEKERELERVRGRGEVKERVRNDVGQK